MKRVRIASAIICLIIDIVICFMVCKQWAAVGCGAWSLIAAIVFYSIGCFGLWVLIDQVLDWFTYIFDDDEYYTED